MRQTKRNFLIILTIILVSGISSCTVNNDYYNTNPNNTGTGYQYLFNEDFNSDTRGWAFDDPIDSAYALVSNGMYKMVDYSFTGGYHIAAVSTGANVNRNFLVQSRIKSNNAMALIFGASPNSYGYSFFIDDTGYFAVYKEGTSPQTLITWTKANAIKVGWNDVEVEQIADYWNFYINGTKVWQTPARTLGGSQMGFMVLPNTIGFADYLTLKW
ncbi:MAG: hypothetical protein JSS64_09205 [Bacteroidetes bacterium]|nr:hypothetical protein [Bacteroidota bacterium]